MQEMIEHAGFKEEAQIIIPAVANRMSKLPFAEPSEEVRVQLISFLDACLEADKEQFVLHLGPVCKMLGNALTDPNPEMKITAAKFASHLAQALEKRVGGYFRMAADSMVGNLSHQHSKVRKQTLMGLKEVLACKGAEPFFEHNMQQLKFTMNDRSQDVRSQFYQVLFHWM